MPDPHGGRILRAPDAAPCVIPLSGGEFRAATADGRHSALATGALRVFVPPEPAAYSPPSPTMSRTLTRAPFLRASLATLLLAAAACSDSSGPATTRELPIDAATFAERGALVAAVTEQPILQQLASDEAFVSAAARVPSARVPAGLRAAQRLAPLMLRTPDASTPAMLGGMLRGALAPEALAPRAEFMPGDPVVPQEMRGYTLVYSFTTGWAIDRLTDGSARPGAPVNGVRFVIQALDEYGEPTGTRLGFLELVDNSDSGTTRYGIRVVTQAGLVVLASNTTLGGTEIAPVFSQTGYVTDGTRRIDESFTVTSRGVSYGFDAPFAGVRYALALSGDPMSGTARLVFDITVDGTRIRMAMTTTETSVTTVISVNGAVWARQRATVDVEGNIVEGEWMQGDGRTPLTVEQLGQLDALGAAMEQASALDAADYTASDWVMQASY